MDIAAAAGIVFDEHGRILLVRRLRPPSAHTWSIPGGKCRPDEPPADACVRELAEETGLIVEVIRHAGRVYLPASGLDGVGGLDERAGVGELAEVGIADRFVVDDFVCQLIGGELLAGDDAGAAGWFSRAELLRLPVSGIVLMALTDWRLLPD